MSNEIYSNLKFMHFFPQLEALCKKQLVAPVHIRLKPTNVCNHSCSYCAYRAKDLQLGETMQEKDTVPWPKMQEFIADIAEMGVKAVTFSGGGEPLIYPQFVETVQLLAANKIKIGILSNGSRLSGEIAEAIGAHATWIRVSIDGWDDKSYAEYRHTSQKEFAHIIENMKSFSLRFGKKCVLGVNINVDQKNASHVTELCRTLKDCGVRHVKVAGVVVSNEGKDNNEYHRPFRERVQKQISTAEQELNSPEFEMVNHYHEMTERFDKSYTICPSIMFRPVMAADCNVYSCQDKAYNEAGLIGSIKEQGFKELWFSEATLKRVYELNPSKICRHHCVADKRNRMLDEFMHLDPEHLAFI
jgi:MoaA/NifB/PqqE/SkfB family radical SAM enzyme